MEDLFDLLTKTLNTNSEAWHTLQNQTLEALAYNTNVLKALDPQQQSNSLDDRAVSFKDDRGKTFTVDNDMIAILIEMGKQTNNQFQLISVDANSNNFKINGARLALGERVNFYWLLVSLFYPLLEIIIGLLLFFYLLSSSQFLLRPCDVTTTSNLPFVHSFMQFQLNCLRDVIFRSWWSEFFFVHSRD